MAGGNNANEEVWVPRVMVRHQGSEGLETNYVSLIEPFNGKTGRGNQNERPGRLSLKQGVHDASGDLAVAIRVDLTDGRSDLIISSDSGVAFVQPDEKNHDRRCLNILDPSRFFRVRSDTQLLRRD